jgi:two-component system sensor histidine kinase/response regulator
LKTVRGKPATYLRLLTMLLEHHQTDAQQLREYLDSENWLETGRLTHSLKGVAGNIGAMEIHSLAAALNNAVRQDGDPQKIKAYGEELAAKLQHLLAAIAEAVALAGQTAKPE